MSSGRSSSSSSEAASGGSGGAAARAFGLADVGLFVGDLPCANLRVLRPTLAADGARSSGATGRLAASRPSKRTTRSTRSSTCERTPTKSRRGAESASAAGVLAPAFGFDASVTRRSATSAWHGCSCCSEAKAALLCAAVLASKAAISAAKEASESSLEGWPLAPRGGDGAPVAWRLKVAESLSLFDSQVTSLKRSSSKRCCTTDCSFSSKTTSLKSTFTSLQRS
mmetsp:Transcript_9800/g.32287  ORF Transcript_9800/g.32287 Transcript_9800/m.32287 type:complete len:225 (+) Transcript_9800:126-800(+)